MSEQFDERREVITQLQKELADLKAKYENAVNCLLSISKTKISGSDVYDAADGMVYAAKETLAELGEK